VCIGNSTESQNCNKGNCLGMKLFISCVVKKYFLKMIKNRFIISKNFLEYFFANFISDSCNFAGLWSNWTAWSSCSVTCDIGTQNRSRVCTGGSLCIGNETDSQNCNNGNCTGKILNV
jgi:hypothetical protein